MNCIHDYFGETFDLFTERQVQNFMIVFLSCALEIKCMYLYNANLQKYKKKNAFISKLSNLTIRLNTNSILNYKFKRFVNTELSFCNILNSIYLRLFLWEEGGGGERKLLNSANLGTDV